MGTLNRVWTHIESFERSLRRSLPTPGDCQSELVRFLGLLPLGQLDFRLDMGPVSGASISGGGICAPAGLAPLGGWFPKVDYEEIGASNACSRVSWPWGHSMAFQLYG